MDNSFNYDQNASGAYDNSMGGGMGNTMMGNTMMGRSLYLFFFLKKKLSLKFFIVKRWYNGNWPSVSMSCLWQRL